jgi:DNA-binding protein H-NS
MAKFDLKTMDVDALLALRGDVDSILKERAKDLQRQIALLSDSEPKRRGRPFKETRESALKGRAVPPKYRGPNGETWAGRGAMPRWLAALIKEGHSVDEFLIGAGGKRKSAAAKKKTTSKKAAKPARKPRAPKISAPEAEPAAA